MFVCRQGGERRVSAPLELRSVSEPRYTLLWQRSFPCPLMGLDQATMMGDGIQNLVVLTTHGLHIMQVCVCVCLCVWAWTTLHIVVLVVLTTG